MKVQKRKALLDRVGTIRNLQNEGYNQIQIAKLMGISRQRVNQLLGFNKENARRRLNYHVKAGHIIKPIRCEGCGAAAVLEAHHHDYGLPLEVAWLCKGCHTKETDYSDFRKRLRPKHGLKSFSMLTEEEKEAIHQLILSGTMLRREISDQFKASIPAVDKVRDIYGGYEGWKL